MPYYSRNKRMLNEYTLVSGTREADEPNDNQGAGAQQQPTGGQQQGGGMPTAGGPQGGAPDMGGGMPQTGNDPNMGGQQPPMGGDPNGGMPDMGGDPGMGGAPDMGGDPNGGTDMADGLDIPQDGMDGFGGPIEDVDMDAGPMQPDDEVIDVDDLTNAQEEASARIDGVDDKLTTLGKVIEKFIEAIKQNDSKIEDLKAEFEKRNPTQQEKFNIRSQASGPFTQSPKDYWDKVASTNPNYQVMYNNDVPTKDEQQEFELRKCDIDGMDDRSVISSFDYPTKLEDILDF